MESEPIEGSAIPPRPGATRSVVTYVWQWLGWVSITRVMLGASSVAIVVFGGWWLTRAPEPPIEQALPTARVSAISSTLPVATSPPSTTVPGTATVHVAGRVAHPGVYRLQAGDRVNDAVVAAGGPTDDAALDGLNLAAVLVDGQRVYVPAVGEIDPSTVPEIAASVANGATVGSAAPGGPVDVNSADTDALIGLPGIGPATAAAIIDERERNGPFVDLDDLQRVAGIGPAKVEALRDRVVL